MVLGSLLLQYSIFNDSKLLTVFPTGCPAGISRRWSSLYETPLGRCLLLIIMPTRRTNRSVNRRIIVVRFFRRWFKVLKALPGCDTAPDIGSSTARCDFQPVGRLPMIEWANWWGDTIERWRKEGLLDYDFEHDRNRRLLLYRYFSRS
mgnify:CR=1 FL=1